MNIIYKTTNKVNGKYYIGMQNTDDDSYLGSGLALIRAIKKYGKHSFMKEVLHTCSDKHEAARLEAEIVTEDVVNDPMCYNMKLGGMGGSMKGSKRPDRSKKYIDKQWVAKVGTKNPRSKGLIKTPWGVYESTALAARACEKSVTAGYLLLACQKNNNKPITYLSVCRSKGFLEEKHIGLTPREIGFGIITNMKSGRKKNK